MRKSDQYKTMKQNQLVAIGQRIKELRKYFRLSQKELAESLHMANSYISDIENGKANPGPEFFLKISNKYNVRIEYLFHGTGEMLYGINRNVDSEEFDFNEDVDTIGKVVWLMEHSPLFKNTTLGFASKFMLDNERILKKSIRKYKTTKGDKT